MGKVCASNINKISSSQFKETIIDGKTMKGQELKGYIKKMAQGGKTLSSIEKKLKDSGVTGRYIRKRQSIMSTIGGDKPITHEQKKDLEKKQKANIRESRRSAEQSGTKYQRSSVQYAQGKTETSSRVGIRGLSGSNKSGLGIKKISTGFAGQFKKVPSKPMSQTGGGTRPLGL